MTSGVYAITNAANGKVYIGSSKNIELRWLGRRSALNRGVCDNPDLQADWSAARGEGFELTVLEETTCDEDVLVEAEQRWLNEYRDRCYNARTRVSRASNPGRSGGATTKLEQAILDWLARREALGEPEAHGYLLAKGAQEVMVSKNLPAHGTLYNALERMERDGRLVSRWEDAEIAEREKRPRRRFYRRPPSPGPQEG